MKLLTILLTFAIAVVFIGSTMASPPGKTVEYEGGVAGKVIFDGKTHADAGLKCIDCHPKLFQMKIGTFKMPAPHKAGELCGVCHDGTKAFGQVNPDTCVKCHKK